ncbi:MAG TPA: hypothetical protein VGG89_15775 [Candidatus Baltobacteraceae bacterium]
MRKVTIAKRLPAADAIADIGRDAMSNATAISIVPIARETPSTPVSEYIQDMSGL